VRLFDNPESSKKWDCSASFLKKEILCVSNVTLNARLKGHKPAFESVMPPDDARTLYSHFLQSLQQIHPAPVKGELRASRRSAAE
jgi:D-Tyr-tRNAtyr deacylase